MAMSAIRCVEVVHEIAVRIEDTDGGNTALRQFFLPPGLAQ